MKKYLIARLIADNRFHFYNPDDGEHLIGTPWATRRTGGKLYDSFVYCETIIKNLPTGKYVIETIYVNN